MTTATSSAYAATLVDILNRMDPNGQVSAVAELLSQDNEILEDMLWVEGNLPTGHRTTVRTDIPSGTWRKLNYGVQPTKSKTAQITDSCGMLEAYAEIDKALADLNGNSQAFRLSEAMAFIEGLNQNFATTVFYGDTAVNAERFLGFGPRYNSPTAANIGTNVIDAGGRGSDNTSIYLVGWGANTVHGIYPKGSQGGLQRRDLGEQTLWDGQTPPGKYQGYREHFKWDCGLTVRDWRYVARIANIDVSDAVGETAGAADLIKNMIKATYRIPKLNMCRPVFYVNRTVAEMLHIQAMTKAIYQIRLEEVGGKVITVLNGIPIKRCDALLTSEAAIS